MPIFLLSKAVANEWSLRWRNFHRCGASRRGHTERSDRQGGDDRRTADRPEHRVRAAGRLLQQSDDIGPENRAYPADPQFHADTAGAEIGLVRAGGKIVQHMLRADDAESGIRDDRQVESVATDEGERKNGKSSNGPPSREVA